MSDEHADIERSFDRAEIATLFREFALAFEGDRPIAIDRPDDEGFVEFDPPRRASVELELESERIEGDEDGESTVELEIEIEWSTGEVDPVTDVDATEVTDVDATEVTDVDSTEVTDVDSTEVTDVDDDTDEAKVHRHGSDPDAIDENATPVASGEPNTGRRSRFEVYRDRADEFRWRLVHWNGNIIADSGEGYSSRANAVNGLRSVVENAPTARIEQLD